MRTSSFAVLRLLTEERFRSGAEIGAALGLSRSMVWRAVRELEARGLKVFRVRGRGYRLGLPFDALDADAIGARLGRRHAGLRLQLLDECDSTNSVLAARAAGGAPSGTALLLKGALEKAGYKRPIDVSSTRAGHIPGTHTIGFDGPAESITLSHTARDRSAFARGALQAAQWVKGRRGWFTMRDVLGI